MIRNGVPWFDDRGETVNAHGACIVEHEGRYWLFGEYKTDDENVFAGFSCYSSRDLATWQFEGMALPQQPAGLLGPGRIGERVKVMRCPRTEQFMMYMHTDDSTYTDPQIGLAVSNTVEGPYQLLGALQFKGQPIRRWDMGTFQDDDGTGFVLIHEGDIYRLSADYTEVEELVAHQIAPGGESPAMLRAGDHYALLFSNKTSWERNDNYHLTAPAPAGPWTPRGLIAPEGSLTHNSQCSFVLPLEVAGERIHMYMGDRWSFPHQASSATQVWLPLEASTAGVQLPAEYWPVWDPQSARPLHVPPPTVPLEFRSNTRGARVDIPVAGSRVSLHGTASPDGGYALVELTDEQGSVLISQLIDFYAKVHDSGLRFVSPLFEEQQFRLRVTVTGEQPVWTDKSGNVFGSTDCYVQLTGIHAT